MTTEQIEYTITHAGNTFKVIYTDKDTTTRLVKLIPGPRGIGYKLLFGVSRQVATAMEAELMVKKYVKG